MRVLSLVAYLLVTGFLTFLAGMWLHNQAQAHIHDRPDLSNWFEGLHNNQGGSCCHDSMKEAVVIDDYTANGDGSYEINLDGHKVHVEERQIVTVPNKYGMALAWPQSGRHAVWCFLPGAGT